MKNAVVVNAYAHVTALMGLVAIEAAQPMKRAAGTHFYFVHRGKANACSTVSMRCRQLLAFKMSLQGKAILTKLGVLRSRVCSRLEFNNHATTGHNIFHSVQP